MTYNDTPTGYERLRLQQEETDTTVNFGVNGVNCETVLYLQHYQGVSEEATQSSIKEAVLDTKVRCGRRLQHVRR